MQHPDEGTIHAWLDGALPASEASAIEEHVASCSECEARVAEARGLIAATSRIVEHLDVVPGKVIPAAAPARRKSWLRSPWPAAIAATLVVGIGFLGTRDRGSPPPVIPPAPRSVSEGSALPKASTKESRSLAIARDDKTPKASTKESRSLAMARDDKTPNATAQKTSVAATPPTPAPRAAERAPAPPVPANSRASDIGVASAEVGRAPTKAAAGARGGVARAAAPPAAQALGAFTRADEFVDASAFVGCYEFDGAMTHPPLPDRFSLTDEPGAAPTLLRIRQLDDSGFLPGVAWKVERGRAVVLDDAGKMVITISKTDNGITSTPAAVRVISCK